MKKDKEIRTVWVISACEWKHGVVKLENAEVIHLSGMVYERNENYQGGYGQFYHLGYTAFLSCGEAVEVANKILRKKILATENTLSKMKELENDYKN